MTIKLYQGDCLNVLRLIPDNSIDSVVTDPPYGLSEHSTEDILKCMTSWISGETYVHDKAGFMQKTWDSFVPGPEVWKECFRVLKPGGHILAFAGTRTMDLMGMAIRLSGFEMRENLGWIFAQGMPHGLNIAKSMSKQNPVEAEKWEGWHTTLKPAFEPIIMARKPLEGNVVDNVLKHGVGGLNIDACRIPVDLEIDDPRLGGKGDWKSDKMAKNVYGTFKGDERISSSELGRYPSNVMHDGSNVVMDTFAEYGEKKSGVPGKRQKPHATHSMAGTLNILDRNEIGYADSGSAARFFYCGKVSPSERGNSKHPTKKPIALMGYLVKMVCPKGGVVLDPFAGSGTTGQGALDNGCKAILIEREEEYIKEIEERFVLFMNDDTQKILYHLSDHGGLNK